MLLFLLSYIFLHVCYIAETVSYPARNGKFITQANLKSYPQLTLVFLNHLLLTYLIAWIRATGLCNNM